MPGPIVVIGSINMDLVCRTPRIPRQGETIMGSDFLTMPGGKGANQAVAAARLADRGTTVHMIGRVGNDEFGRQLVAGLSSNGVRVERVICTDGIASGCALIQVDGHGENSIVVVPGANARVSKEDVQNARELIASASCVVMQLEIPLETVEYAINLCRELGVFTILDPAPVPPQGLPTALYAVDLLTPNQTEAELILGGASDTEKKLIDRGARTVVLKLGASGSIFADKKHIESAEPFSVKAVDTTAAGDAFTGALAVAHSEGLNTSATLRFANAAGAICCQTMGAQAALPPRVAVDAMIGPRSSDRG
jgi:ribokinase